LFYGRLAESIGAEVELDVLPVSSVAQIRERLIAEYPEVEQSLRSRRSRACVGETIVQDDYLLDTAGTVEFLPPVSGG
jgi:molybdopterin converting factor small subunit